MAQRLLIVLRSKVAQVEGPMAKQVGTLEFFLASTLKGKTDDEIATVLQLVIDTMTEVLNPIDDGETLLIDLADILDTDIDHMHRIVSPENQQAIAEAFGVEPPDEQ